MKNELTITTKDIAYVDIDSTSIRYDDKTTISEAHENCEVKDIVAKIKLRLYLFLTFKLEHEDRAGCSFVAFGGEIDLKPSILD